MEITDGPSIYYCPLKAPSLVPRGLSNYDYDGGTVVYRGSLDGLLFFV